MNMYCIYNKEKQIIKAIFNSNEKNGEEWFILFLVFLFYFVFLIRKVIGVHHGEFGKSNEENKKSPLISSPRAEIMLSFNCIFFPYFFSCAF